MTTKLDAINSIISEVGLAPLKTLTGIKSYDVIKAENILETTVKQVCLKGYAFNNELNYPLFPDQNKEIRLAKNMLDVKIKQPYLHRYVIRNQKLYDKINHTFIINHKIMADITFYLEFEVLPEVVKHYITMLAANKFVKRVLGSKSVYAYSQEDLMEALILMETAELETGNYSFIKEYYTNQIKGSI